MFQGESSLGGPPSALLSINKENWKNEAGVRMSHTDANPININKIQLNLSVAWLLKMVEPTLFLCHLNSGGAVFCA